MIDIQEITNKLRETISKTIIGQHQNLDYLFAALYSNGHVLLEDVPGVGKTVLAKAFSASIGAKYKRIQCTPDLLPSDVIGTTMYNQKSTEFEFHQGPLFSQCLLVDEINRAIPRTQSALLEAMAEHQITVEGTTYPLAPPFFVMATQNPIESHGTFPLPEAQLDRFLMKISLGYPSVEEESTILQLSKRKVEATSMESMIELSEILEIQKQILQIRMDVEVERYLLDIVRTTRNHSDITLGASPRGTIALSRVSQALAAIRGRNYVIPDDIKELAPIVLSHRLQLNTEARMKRRKAQEIIKEIVEGTVVPVENDLTVEEVK